MGGVDNSKDFRRARLVVDAMHVHLIFVTKYRRHVLDSATDALRTMFTTICGDFGANLRGCDGGGRSRASPGGVSAESGDLEAGEQSSGRVFAAASPTAARQCPALLE